MQHDGRRARERRARRAGSHTIRMRGRPGTGARAGRRAAGRRPGGGGNHRRGARRSRDAFRRDRARGPALRDAARAVEGCFKVHRGASGL